MFHKGMTGRTEENGPASVKNDIGKRGGQDLYLRDYITRKQESDTLFTGASMTTSTLREAATKALGMELATKHAVYLTAESAGKLVDLVLRAALAEGGAE